MPATELAAGAPAGVTADQPTSEQLAAVSARDRDTFCEAAAGSGKTRVLVDRYVEALVTDGVPVEGILAFTFTERGDMESCNGQTIVKVCSKSPVFHRRFRIRPCHRDNPNVNWD